MSYRGPDPARIRAHVSTVQRYNAETAVLRQFVSAATGSTSAYLGGAGQTRYYTERPISGLIAPPAQRGDTETLLPAGEVLAGDMLISTFARLQPQDEVVWRDVVYRVASDAVPIHIGGRVWYRALLRRGDRTG